MYAFGYEDTLPCMHLDMRTPCHVCICKAQAHLAAAKSQQAFTVTGGSPVAVEVTVHSGIRSLNHFVSHAPITQMGVSGGCLVPAMAEGVELGVPWQGLGGAVEGGLGSWRCGVGCATGVWLSVRGCRATKGAVEANGIAMGIGRLPCAGDGGGMADTIWCWVGVVLPCVCTASTLVAASGRHLRWLRCFSRTTLLGEFWRVMDRVLVSRVGESWTESW